MSFKNIALQSKLPTVSSSIFTVMSKLAHTHQALNLAQGFPDFQSDPQLIELVSRAMKNGYNQYAPMQGVLKLRTQIAEKFFSLYGAVYNPETEITVTSGATQALFTIISAFVNKDDEVLIFKPAYDCYEPAITLQKGQTISVQLHGPKYQIDWNFVGSLINSKTKMIIINTPHNPSGVVWRKEDMQSLENIVKDTDIIVVSDEVYEHIVFDKQPHQSACLFSGLKERSFIVASFGKTFHNTGWKMGYCTAPKALMSEFRKVHQFNVFSANHPIQIALAGYLKNASNYLDLNSFYQQKRDFFLNAIKNSRFDVIPSSGTYFQLLDYRAITTKNDVEFATELVKKNKIAAIPISVFNDNGLDHKLLRFCFAKKEETLSKAAAILCAI